MPTHQITINDHPVALIISGDNPSKELAIYYLSEFLNSTGETDKNPRQQESKSCLSDVRQMFSDKTAKKVIVAINTTKEGNHKVLINVI